MNDLLYVVTRYAVTDKDIEWYAAVPTLDASIRLSNDDLIREHKPDGLNVFTGFDAAHREAVRRTVEEYS